MSRLDPFIPTSQLPPPDPLYPEDDGKPLAENTLQLRIIFTIVGGLKALYRNDPNVFIAGDLLWYPVGGNPKIRQAPDVMVVFGRPPGERRSYLQWREENIPPQVTFEIASQNNTRTELEVKKRDFYQRYGVQEYYVFYPLQKRLKGWLREGNQLIEIPEMQGWESPRLQLRFHQEENELYLYRRDGERLRDYPEVVDQLEESRQKLEEERQQSQKYRQQLQQEQEQSQAYRQQRDTAIIKLLEMGLSVEAVAETFSLPVAVVIEINDSRN